jgi:hypothetical protein
MALKIVHLCDVHSSKGEDIPAAFAHTIVVDGGTFAIDLCGVCDQERYLPLVGFLDAFGLLTDGTVDPRESVAEDLRRTFAGSELAKPAAPASKAKPPTSSTPRATAVAVQTAPEPLPEPDGGTDRLADVLDALRAAPEGLPTDELAVRVGLAPSYVSKYTSELRKTNRADYLSHKWYATEHVPVKERERLQRMRDVTAARDATPRICIVDGATLNYTQAWEQHCLQMHSVKPAQLLGLTCPFDGETFSTAQLLGMHGRQAHDCVHTPQLFLKADNVGDPLGLIADIRARFRKDES